MNKHIIRDRFTGVILFQGRFSSLREAAELAVKDGIVLDNADFAGANLVNAALDEDSFRRADFSGANLMGANISEARLDGADFTNAGLQNACLAFSSMKGCDFSEASFGATDIAGGDISGSRFSTLSAFSINFTDARDMAGCLYTDPDAGPCPMNAPPVTLEQLEGTLEA